MAGSSHVILGANIEVEAPVTRGSCQPEHDFGPNRQFNGCGRKIAVSGGGSLFRDIHGTVTNLNVEGSVTLACSDGCGGIGHRLLNSGELRDSRFLGSVTCNGADDTGGALAICEDGDIVDVSVDVKGPLGGGARTGGLVGTATRCFVQGEVTTDDPESVIRSSSIAGGAVAHAVDTHLHHVVVGSVAREIKISATANGSVAGGVVGIIVAAGSSIERAQVNAFVEGHTVGGGLAGSCTDATVKLSTVSNVRISSEGTAGGLVGVTIGSNPGCQIRTSIVTGSNIAGDTAGGAVGLHNGSSNASLRGILIDNTIVNHSSQSGLSGAMVGRSIGNRPQATHISITLNGNVASPSSAYGRWEGGAENLCSSCIVNVSAFSSIGVPLIINAGTIDGGVQDTYVVTGRTDGIVQFGIEPVLTLSAIVRGNGFAAPFWLQGQQLALDPRCLGADATLVCP